MLDYFSSVTRVFRGFEMEVKVGSKRFGLTVKDLLAAIVPDKCSVKVIYCSCPNSIVYSSSYGSFTQCSIYLQVTIPVVLHVYFMPCLCYRTCLIYYTWGVH